MYFPEVTIGLSKESKSNILLEIKYKEVFQRTGEIYRPVGIGKLCFLEFSKLIKIRREILYEEKKMFKNLIGCNDGGSQYGRGADINLGK